MSNISSELQCSTIANMLATELKRQGIPISEDPDVRYNILYNAAELILYEGEVSKDIGFCVDAIKDYINETKTNYPNYFITGENI